MFGISSVLRCTECEIDRIDRGTGQRENVVTVGVEFTVIAYLLAVTDN